MDELISTFHIDVKLLIAQAVNFAIVFAVLYYFAIKPLVKILQERSKKIEDSLKNAERVERELEETRDAKEKILDKARMEASKILVETEKKAEGRREEILKDAKKEIEVIITKTKNDLQKQKVETISEIKAEAGELVVEAVRRVLEDKMSSEVDRKYVDEIIRRIDK